MAVRKKPREIEAGSLDESDLGRQRRSHVADIGGPTLRGGDEPDEMAAVARDVQSGRVLIDVALEVADDLPPDIVFTTDLALVETCVVELGQQPCHGDPAAVFGPRPPYWWSRGREAQAERSMLVHTTSWSIDPTRAR